MNPQILRQTPKIKLEGQADSLVCPSESLHQVAEDILVQLPNYFSSNRVLIVFFVTTQSFVWYKGFK